MRPLDPENEDEPLDLGLFEMMMGMTPQEWDAPMSEQDDGSVSALHNQ
ncbi:hypothetical protein M2336_003617 [Sphingobium sp. B1D7B]|nr:hypothetical protein [Sphingobium sp. B1D7B]MCW2406933.1 hypothetical protein [Sphingobium sp. B1D7B]